MPYFCSALRCVSEWTVHGAEGIHWMRVSNLSIARLAKIISRPCDRLIKHSNDSFWVVNVSILTASSQMQERDKIF